MAPLTPVWLNDRLVPAEQAAVSVFDHGFTVGDGVFETTKVIGGRPFALTRHLTRLRVSAERLSLSLPSEERLREAVAAICATVGDIDLARLRVTVTGGAGPPGSDRGSGPPTLLVTVTAFTPRMRPETVVTVPWRRNEHSATAGVKSTSYAENVVALAAARRAGGGEALLANTAGDLCEGTGTNVFCVLDGVAVTPPLSSGCLAGVTRALLLEWCPAVIERPIGLDEMARAQEVFLTSSTRDVQAVELVDGHRPGGPSAAVPGPVTTELAAVYAQRASRDPDP